MIQKGDTIGIIALSGECKPEKIESAKLAIENLGYKVKLSKNIFDKCRYLAGSDSDKITELHSFFEDKEIKLILAARGGYGVLRLVNKIDYEIIKRNPKQICGFSDVTALLLMIYKKTGLITYHSPMACTGDDFSNSYTVEHFFNAINSDSLNFPIDKFYKKGIAEGILWGGNLSTIVSLCGLDFIPDKSFVLFTEDVNEPVYKIDKMFQQLFNMEIFKHNIKGIILGDFTEIDNKNWLNDYFIELAERIEIPIVTCSGITHNNNKITLPIGANVKINSNNLNIIY